MPAYKLTYFNARGRGEIMRLLFAEAKEAYDDCRIEKDQWPALKASTPFGQLPMLEVDGVKLCQSTACARYLARKFHLAGKSELEQAQTDMVVDCIEDSAKPMISFFFEKDEAKKTELKKKYNEEQLPAFLTLLENLLKQNNGGDDFFVGKGVTWADLYLLGFIGWTNMAGNEDPLGKHPKLKALKAKVENLPNIKAWIAKRPKTDT